MNLTQRLARHGPLLALAVALALPLALELLAPDWLGTNVLEPWRAQADPERGLRTGYTPASLAFWAVEGALLAFIAYRLVFMRWALEPDRRFFGAIAPLLVVGPLGHALLAAGAIAPGTPLAYLVAEPPVYLSVALVAIAGLALGRAFQRTHLGLYAVGVLALAPLLVLALRIVSAADAGRVAGILTLALAAAALVTLAARRLDLPAPPLAIFAVVAAHALDGASTWLGLRDPFGWGFQGMRESNPLAETLVNLSNGWPYFVVKLALPILLLLLVRSDHKETPEPHEAPRDPETEHRMRAFLLFAVFVLGYGPGMSNTLQVLLA